MKIERIANGFEVIEENGCVFINFLGKVLNTDVSFEAAVQSAAEVMAGGRQKNFGSDPLKYIAGAAAPETAIIKYHRTR